ncbi:CaiB/BaiF CoA transferase family protein [Brevibacterium sp. FAM 24638]|uniref:CaiB/BaiF CoA transferase family protein n=1 Tax=Brevibacterium sp. FAM 24638 TaxID=3415681 RepID=UPI003C7E1ABA
MTNDQASEAMRNGPLTSLRVLELGNMIAAPTAGTQFADFGAEVVKVEHPVHGDDLRQWPPNKGDVPLWWKVTNRNKKLITVDLSTGEGAATIRDAVPEFDIVLENFRPGTLERWGIGPDVLVEINPQLIVARISGYGQTGPYSKRGGYGTVAEAISGIPSFTGPKDGPPTLSAFPLVDVLAGHSAVQGVLMALHERSQSGLGQVVDVSLYESLFRLADAQVIGYDQAGIVKQRNGNRMDEDSPRNTYETADTKWIAISAGSQRTFSRLAAAIGRPELTQDPRFNTNRNRVVHAEELDSIMADWFRPRTSTEAMEIMVDNDVVAGLVYTIADIFEDPHFAARENIIELEDRQLGTVRMQNVSPKLSRTPGRVRWTGGEMGDDNEEVLARFATVNQ